jgi:hypothetical protein
MISPPILKKPTGVLRDHLGLVLHVRRDLQGRPREFFATEAGHRNHTHDRHNKQG